MQFKGLGFPTSILQCKIGVCIDRRTACVLCEAFQSAFKIWNSFFMQDRPFSSSTWSGRLFFCAKIFEVVNHSEQCELVPTHNFWIWFYKSKFKNTCWASPKPDIPHKNCAGCASWWTLHKKIFRENSFKIISRWFTQYRVKLELLLPVLRVKSGSNAS